MDNNVHLSEDDKLRVTLQVDHFIEILSRRYGIDPKEVVEAVTWVRERKQFSNRFHAGAIISMISVLVGAILLSLWEGIKHFIKDRS